MARNSDDFERLTGFGGRSMAAAIAQQQEIMKQMSGIDWYLEQQRSALGAMAGLNSAQSLAQEAMRYSERSASAALDLGFMSASDPTQHLRDIVAWNGIAGYQREEIERQLKPYAWTDSLSALVEEWRPSVLASSIAANQLSAKRFIDDQAAQHSVSLGLPLRDWLGASATADALSVLGVTSLVEDQAKQLKSVLDMVDFAGLQSRMSDLEQRLTRDLAQFSAITSLGMARSALDGMDLSWLRQQVEATVEAAFDHAEAADLEPSKLYRLKLWMGRHITMLLIGKILLHAVGLTADFAQLTSKDATTVEMVAAPAPALCAESLMVVNRDGVRLRAGPTSSDKVVIKLSRSHFVEKLGTSGQWVHVKYIDLQGNGVSYTGWVYGKYLEHAQVATLRMLCEAAAAPDQDKPSTSTDS